MMKYEIQPGNTIRSGELSEDNYFESLIEQALLMGKADQTDVDRLQREGLYLLKQKTEQFNKRSSSSIRVEIAQEIMDSVFYTVGLYLKTCPTPDEAVELLKKQSLEKLYMSGRKRIDVLLAITRTLHKKLLSGLFDTGNVFYRATLDCGIRGFFKLYNPDSFADEMHITADYPLCGTRPKTKGVEFIAAYLQGAYYENQFLGYFQAQDVHYLLRGYTPDYKEQVINLFCPVLTAALGAAICDTDPLRLSLSERQAEALCAEFGAISRDAYEARLYKAAEKLSGELKLSTAMYRYIQGVIPYIASEIRVAVKNGTPERMFFAPSYQNETETITFSFGAKMSNVKYRGLLRRFNQCGTVGERIELIRDQIKTLSDFTDLLKDAELSDADAQSILRELSLPEIAALMRKYHAQMDTSPFEYRTADAELRRRLRSLFNALPDNRQRMIEKIQSTLKMV